MTNIEFKEVAEEVFSELLPKVRAVDRKEAIAQLIVELKDQGLDIEDEDDDEEETEED